MSQKNLKLTQWLAFRKRLQLDHVPESFQEIVFAIELFLKPIASAISSETLVLEKWNAPGPWVAR